MQFQKILFKKKSILVQQRMFFLFGFRAKYNVRLVC